MDRPPIYDEELLAEARAFNSTLTKAGQKPRTRSGNGPRGGGFGLNPSRSAVAKHGLRPRVGTGGGMVEHHVNQASVRPRGGAGFPVGGGNSGSPPNISPWSNPQVGSDFTPASFGGVVDSSMMANTSTGASFQVELVANPAAVPTPAQAFNAGFVSTPAPIATAQPTYEELAAELENMRTQMKLITQRGGLMDDTSATSTQTTPRAANLSQIASGILGSATHAHGLQASVATISTGPAASSSSQSGNATGSPVLERKLITTNWGMYGEPVGPDIPGHLRQSHAPAAIEEISRMTGRPYGELTKDGVTLSGPPVKKCDASQQKTQITVDYTLTNDANADHRMLSSEMDIVAPETKPAPARGEFNKSMVAGNQWGYAWKESSAAASALAWNANAASNRAENVPPMTSILQDPKGPASNFTTRAQRAKLLSESSEAANKSFAPVTAKEAERATRAFAELASKPGNKFKDSRWAN